MFKDFLFSTKETDPRCPCSRPDDLQAVSTEIFPTYFVLNLCVCCEQKSLFTRLQYNLYLEVHTCTVCVCNYHRTHRSLLLQD